MNGADTRQPATSRPPGVSPSERQGNDPAAFFSSRPGVHADGARPSAPGRRLLARALLALRAGAARLRPRRPYNVLRIELSGELAEGVAEGFGAGALFRRGPAPLDLLTLLATLRTAREDSALGLVLLDVHGLRAGWSRIQSVRRALLDLRAAGKRVWAYLADAGMHEYYLASAADRVVLAPAATFDATGIASEVVFLKGALDKLGIEAQVTRVGRFKSAGEPLTRTSMSVEHRAMLDELFDDLYAQLVADVATARRLDDALVRRAFEEGPLLADEALGRGLVDAVAYPDEVDEQLADLFGDPAPIELARYQKRRALAVRRAALGAPAIGLLTVSGPIGTGSRLPLGRGSQASDWRAFKRELAALAGDRHLAAIVVRVDSPGGSGLASDLMWREIVQARQRKPVVISMGDVAASGGYYLAAAADHVTAEGATLTGSIGVLAGKPVLRGLYDRLGITKELVVRGNAARHSDYVALDDAELARLRNEAEAFYTTFVGKVADGRRLSRAAVESVAEGRVWSGRQALQHGLVDGLGGLEAAFQEVKRRLGVDAESRLAVERRPKARPWWRLTRFAGSPTGALVADLDTLVPVLSGERVLALMPFSVRSVEPGAAVAMLESYAAMVAPHAAEEARLLAWVRVLVDGLAALLPARSRIVY